YGLHLYLPNPIIQGVTGYLLISHPNVGAAAVAILVAALLFFLGLSRGITASIFKLPNWRSMLFAGLVSLALGIYLLATLPTVSTYLFGVLIGIDLFFDGAAVVAFGNAIRRLPEVQKLKAA